MDTRVRDAPDTAHTTPARPDTGPHHTLAHREAAAVGLLGVVIMSVVDGWVLIMGKASVCGVGVESTPHGGLRVPP